MITPETYLQTAPNFKVLMISISIGKPYSPWTQMFMLDGTTMNGLYQKITQHSNSIDSIQQTQLGVN